VVAQMLREDPNNSSARRCAFWCLYDLAKADLEEIAALDGDPSGDKITRQLKACQDRVVEMMNYYEADAVTEESVGWLAARVAWKASRSKKRFIAAQMVKAYRLAVPEPRAAPYHSLLLKAILQLEPAPAWLGQFLRFWNLSNFLDDDFKVRKEANSGGKRTTGRSLAAKALSAAAKFLTTRPSEESDWFDGVIPQVLPRIEGDKWVSYHLAQYAYSRGRHAEAVQYAVKALVATRFNASVFTLLMSVFDKMSYREATMALALEACFRDPLICRRSVFEVIAKALNERSDHEKAQEWRELTSTFAQVMKANTPNEVRMRQKDFSRRVLSAVERLGDIPERVNWDQFEQCGHFLVGLAVVESVDTNKGVLRVRYGKRQQSVSLRPSQRVQQQVGRIGAGAVLEVVQDRKSGEILLSRMAPPEKHAEVIKEVTGRAQIRAGKDFGFVEDGDVRVFLPPHIVTRLKVQDGSKITVLATKGYDKKRQQEAWQAVRVLSSDNKE
jgi:tetratricopeptide (TPR) repeat protein